MLLFIEFELPGVVMGLLAFFIFIAGILVTAVYYRGGLAEKQAGGYKSLYEMEKERATRYESLYKKENEELNILSNEYGQLSQIYAKKSILLEAFTGDYDSIVLAIEDLYKQGKLKRPIARNYLGDKSDVENTQG